VLTYLVDPISPLQVEAMKEAAATLGVTLQVIDIKTPDDLPAAFEAGNTVGDREFSPPPKVSSVSHVRE
jgi:hypothetical protein